jgi:hypothetical protein
LVFGATKESAGVTFTRFPCLSFTIQDNLDVLLGSDFNRGPFKARRTNMRTANAIGIAGGAVAAALIAALIKKNFFTPDEARAILGDAQAKLMPFVKPPTGGTADDAAEGARIIGEMYTMIPKGSA